MRYILTYVFLKFQEVLTCEHNLNMLLKFRVPLPSTVCIWNHLENSFKLLKSEIWGPYDLLNVRESLLTCEHKLKLLNLEYPCPIHSKRWPHLLTNWKIPSNSLKLIYEDYMILCFFYVRSWSLYEDFMTFFKNIWSYSPRI